MKHDYTDGGCPYPRCRCKICQFWRRRDHERDVRIGRLKASTFTPPKDAATGEK